ncbi:MAG: hypothetical protein JWP52_3986, partial [Rhizobacter sp.]|nr:hypothetical protein [Rhizobacter sp.]
MIKSKHLFLGTAVALACVAAQAQSLNLGNYAVTGNFQLDTLFGTSGQGVSGLEASAVTYNRDTGTLFYVGDEGTGMVEISKTGQTVSTMRFTGWPAASTNHDAEGLTYVGNGQFVTVDERLQDAYKFTYTGNTNFNQPNVSTGVNLANVPSVSIGASAGNSGLEGISFDPRNGSFVSIKQENPENVLGGTLNFTNGASTMSALFNPALLGLSTLSDIQTLSPIDSLAGTAAADNLLVLSLGSRELLEVNRSGQILSSFDLSNVAPHNGIEGVTVDNLGNIYLIAEQSQDGSELDPHSVLIQLS